VHHVLMHVDYYLRRLCDIVVLALVEAVGAGLCVEGSRAVRVAAPAECTYE
jgi:hypothetical protein